MNELNNDSPNGSLSPFHSNTLKVNWPILPWLGREPISTDYADVALKETSLISRITSVAIIAYNAFARE